MWLWIKEGEWGTSISGYRVFSSSSFVSSQNKRTHKQRESERERETLMHDTRIQNAMNKSYLLKN